MGRLAGGVARTGFVWTALFLIACGGSSGGDQTGTGGAGPVGAAGADASSTTTGAAGASTGGARGTGVSAVGGTGGAVDAGAGGATSGDGAAGSSGAGGAEADAAGSTTSTDAGGGGGGLVDGGAVDAALLTACTTKGVFDNQDPTGGGKVFLQYVPDPETFIANAARDVCLTLYEHASEVKAKPTVTLHVQVGAQGAVADSDGTGSNTRFYSGYIQSFASSHTKDQTVYELNGVLHHEFTHLYQNISNAFGNDGGLLEGVADFVRFRTGFIPLTNRHKGGNWDDGYQTTAFFLVYVDDMYPSFVYELNEAVPKWPANNAFFSTTTGKTVDALWAAYQATL